LYTRLRLCLPLQASERELLHRLLRVEGEPRLWLLFEALLCGLMLAAVVLLCLYVFRLSPHARFTTA
jgi:hypothetical protein